MFFDLFREAFLHAQIVPLSQSATFFALRGFGAGDLLIPGLIAAAGATTGQGVNFLLGHGLRLLRKSEKIYMSEALYQRSRRIFHLFLWPSLCLSWTALGVIPVLVAGFLGIPALFTLSLVGLGQAAYYGYYAYM